MHQAPKADLEAGLSGISIERLSKGERKRQAPKRPQGNSVAQGGNSGSSLGIVYRLLQGKWPVDSDWLPVIVNLFKSDSTSVYVGGKTRNEGHWSLSFLVSAHSH